MKPCRMLKVNLSLRAGVHTGCQYVLRRHWIKTISRTDVCAGKTWGLHGNERYLQLNVQPLVV